jgi:glycosyltransferase involved in cell wall biosynthesis
MNRLEIFQHPERTEMAFEGEPLTVLVAVPLRGSLVNIKRIATALASQRQPSGRSVELLVVDNNPQNRDHRVLTEYLSGIDLHASAVREATSGIPFARNAAVRRALEREVDALIFIDADEWPTAGWLDALLGTWQHSGADIVLGPAKGVLSWDAPSWARKSGMFDKDRSLSDGAPIRTAYSYNTLLSQQALKVLKPTFDPVFRFVGSSDHDYFKRANAAGLRSVWSPDALVYEEIGPERLQLRWIVRRGYRTGAGARLSACRRLPRNRAWSKIAVLSLANLAYGGVSIVATVRSPFSWVEGLRRLALAMGLVMGNVQNYQEYGPHRYRA